MKRVYRRDVDFAIGSTRRDALGELNFEREGEDSVKKHAPIQRLDAALKTRLVATANQVLDANGDKRLDARDRELMLGELELSGPQIDRTKSDVYLAQRFRLRMDDAFVGSQPSLSTGAVDPFVPRDGMAAGSTVQSEVLGSGKEQRRRVNAYLNQARTELSAGSMRSQQPNPGDVEDRAAELAKADPKGFFR